MTDRSCGTCRFLQEVSKGVRGECRRYAPRPGGRSGEAVWPGVGLTGSSVAWCGEWEPNEEEMRRITSEAKVNFEQHNAKALKRMRPGPPADDLA